MGNKDPAAERMELMRETMWLYRKTDSMMSKYMEHMVGHTGVYPAQHRLLMELNHNPCSSQVELAEKFEVSAAAIAVSLKKLEEGGYIVRQTNTEDNRINQVSITDKGKSVIRQSLHIFQEADRGFLNGLDDNQLQQLRSYLEQMYENVSDMNNRIDREKKTR